MEYSGCSSDLIIIVAAIYLIKLSDKVFEKVRKYLRR